MRVTRLHQVVSGKGAGDDKDHRSMRLMRIPRLSWRRSVIIAITRGTESSIVCCDGVQTATMSAYFQPYPFPRKCSSLRFTHVSIGDSISQPVITRTIGTLPSHKTYQDGMS